MVVMVEIAQHRRTYGLVLFAITSLLPLLNRQQIDKNTSIKTKQDMKKRKSNSTKNEYDAIS